jgi:hypothetical protein
MKPHAKVLTKRYLYNYKKITAFGMHFVRMEDPIDPHKSISLRVFCKVEWADVIYCLKRIRKL